MTDSNIPQCKIEGCKKPYRARGFCAHHYYKATQLGELRTLPKYRVCSIEGCGKPHNSHSFCSKHSERFLKYGSPHQISAPPLEKRICAADDCENLELDRRGLCSKHFQRFKKHGTTDLIKKARKTPEQSFWEKVIKSENENDCWHWIAATTLDGYGYFAALDQPYRAHRFSFFLHYGYMPENLVLHSCDNPPCCNPLHLREGTDADNADDKRKRNREPRGSRRSKKLTEAIVLDIRRQSANCQTDKTLAEKYGVSESTVYFIRKRRTWTHI